MWSGSENGMRAGRPIASWPRPAQPSPRANRWPPFGPFDRPWSGLIADMRNIVAEGLTASEADAALGEHGRSGRRPGGGVTIAGSDRIRGIRGGNRIRDPGR